MKKGFTLIELLAVIVILAVILVIAVPQILKVIEESKTNSYNNQIKLVENAAKTYNVSNPINFINNQAVITIGDLQTNGLIESNIKDPRTGNAISPDTWIFVLKNGDEYNYIYGYEKEGLIAHYDGIYNGGINIHNDNTSANKSTWKDLSGNNYNATLTNFNYASGSGWIENSLNFDGVNDSVRTYLFGTLSNLTFEILMNKTNSGEVVWTGGRNTLIIYSTGNTYITSNTGFIGNGSTFSIVNNTTYLLSVVYNIIDQKAYYYKNGVLVKQVSLPTNSASFSFIDGQCIFTSSSCSSSFASGNVYNIRMYNRALNDDEIKRNYDVDKVRYGL